MTDYQMFELGDVVLQSKATLRKAKMAYKTFGTLNAKKDNAIVYPTWYSGQHYENEWLIGEGMALDPKKYFIIIPNLFGNGLSTSPSNTPAPWNGPRFPNVTAYDNVRQQYRLVTEKFGIEKIKLVTGWSMGALQTYHWGALYPDMVERILPFQGSAKCSRHNFVFLEGAKAALMADAAFNNGWYDEPALQGAAGVRARLRRLGFLADVLPGQKLDIELQRRYRGLRAESPSSLEDFLVGFWEGLFLAKDANNLLTMLWTWQNGDVSNNRAVPRRPAQGARRHQGQGDRYAGFNGSRTSRPKTTPSKSSTCRTPNCGWSTPIGATSLAGRAPALTTSPCSIRRSRSCWQADPPFFSHLY